MSELTLTLIRGIPGSGKSTLAKKLVQEATDKLVHLEADMFFIDNNGDYHFQPAQLSDAHQWCQQQCRLLLKQKQSVIVSNTFIMQWELKPYRQFAKKYNARLVIKTCTGNYNSIHNVPVTTLKKMKQQWQP